MLDEVLEVTREEAHDEQVCMSAIECDRCCAPFPRDWRVYMVHDSVWAGEAGLPDFGCALCLACLEAVLGRPVACADLSDYPCNEWLRRAFTMMGRP